MSYKHRVLEQGTDIAAVDNVEIGHALMGELELLLADFAATIDDVQPHVHNLLGPVLLDHEHVVDAVDTLNSDGAHLAYLIPLFVILSEFLLEHPAVLLGENVLKLVLQLP